jgi:hypothetical protein
MIAMLREYLYPSGLRSEMPCFAMGGNILGLFGSGKQLIS